MSPVAARLAKLKKLYNQCDPYEPLPPGDARNVDIDALAHPALGRLTPAS